MVTLSTLNTAIEDVLPDLRMAGVVGLEAQTDFLAQCLDAWLDATGRKEDVAESESLDPENVAYQGRAIVSFLTLIPACILTLRKNGARLISDEARSTLEKSVRATMKRAGLLKNGRFLSKSEFKHKGFVASGGLARFRDTLWAATATNKPLPPRIEAERLAELALMHRGRVRSELV